MSKLFVIFIFIVTLSFATTAQDNYQIGLSTGIASAIGPPQKMGLASLVSFTYKPIEEIGIYLSTGRIIFGYRTDKVYNSEITPFILGLKYFFGESKFQPIVSLEIEKIYGEYNYGMREEIDLYHSGEKTFKESTISKLDEYAVAGGIGVINNISDKLNIELNFFMILTRKADSVFHGRLLLGINYTL